MYFLEENGSIIDSKYTNKEGLDMSKIRFGIIGAGWRAGYFCRIAKMLPEVFELVVVMARNIDKGRAFGEQFGVPAVQTLDELEAYDLDYVVLCVTRDANPEYLVQLFERNTPVLCETPPAMCVDDLEHIWEEAKKHNAKIQVAEQYFLQPLYKAWETVIGQGKLGEIQNMNISAVHGYHAVSLIRRYLGVGYENCKVSGKRYEFKVTNTGSRAGMHLDGQIVPSKRDRITFEFESGKVAFFDFAGEQYLSFIRARQLTVQGTRGEIDDLEIRYLTDENIPIHTTLERRDLGVYNIKDWEHHSIMLHDQYVYQNPFEHARLNDDELAIATCMYKMKEYLETGVEFYGLSDAMQDAYLSLVMEESLGNGEKAIETTSHIWVK